MGKALLNVPPLLSQLQGLSPVQCGVGVPNACESIGQGLQGLVDSLPREGDWVVLQVDVSNAFNTIDRTAVLHGAAKHAPAMLAWLKFLYATPATLFCQGD